MVSGGEKGEEEEKERNEQVSSVGESESHDSVLGLNECGESSKVGGRSRANAKRISPTLTPHVKEKKEEKEERTN